MTHAEEQTSDDRRESAPDSLKALAGYLERALDTATSVIMMRRAPDTCTVYLGDPSGPQDELRRVGSIAATLANEMLESTSSGANRMQIGTESYRFVRSFTQIDGTAAVVFSA